MSRFKDLKQRLLDSNVEAQLGDRQRLAELQKEISAHTPLISALTEVMADYNETILKSQGDFRIQKREIVDLEQSIAQRKFVNGPIPYYRYRVDALPPVRVRGENYQYAEWNPNVALQLSVDIMDKFEEGTNYLDKKYTKELYPQVIVHTWGRLGTVPNPYSPQVVLQGFSERVTAGHGNAWYLDYSHVWVKCQKDRLTEAQSDFADVLEASTPKILDHLKYLRQQASFR